MRALPLLAACVAVACALNPVTRRPEVVLVSEAAEKQLGAQEAARVEQEMGLVDAPELVAYVQSLGERLAVHSPREDVDWRFLVVDSDMINAFALPGGHVYVTRGLLAYTNSEDELAGVIGHEIGHVAARHAVQRITRAAPLSVATGVPAAAVGIVLPGMGRALGSVGQFAGSLALAPYGRDQERQSDRLGQEMAAKAGWDPAGLATFMQTLERQEALQAEKGPPWFTRTHPLSAERHAAGVAYAAELERAQADPITPDRTAYLQRLEGLRVGGNPAEGVFEGSVFRQPDLDLRLEFPAGWETQNGPDFVSAWSESGEARVVVQIAGSGDDPLVVARRFAQGGGAAFGLLPRATDLAGHPGARATGRARGATLDVSWIAYGDLVYQITGMCKSEDYERHQTPFIDVALSLRPLTAEERAGIVEERLRLFAAREGETLEALVERTGGLWAPPVAAVANGLDPDAPLTAASWVKLPVAEPYEGASAAGDS